MRMRPLVVVPIVAALGASSFEPAIRTQDPNQSISLATPEGAHIVLTLEVDDRGTPGRASVAAFEVTIDAAVAQQVLMTPGTGRTSYETLLGPLAAGRHEISVAPSADWPRDDSIALRHLQARIVRPGDTEAELIEHAPALGVRADTIGTFSDIPLVMFVEDERRSGAGMIRYSVIFSNEDGGTASLALMARWGRTTDIESAYEILWKDGHIAEERIQAPDHKVIEFRGRRIGRHPYLLVATLNNMFLDRGRSAVMVRLVPTHVSLEQATRESVMDANPWTYLVTARELVAEGKIGPGLLEDARFFVFVDARLDLVDAAVSAGVRTSDGAWTDSSRGQRDLQVARNEWVRIAVPTNGTPPARLRWTCYARGEKPECRILTTRVFTLDDGYRPGPNLVERSELTMKTGVSSAIGLKHRQ